MQHPGSHSRTRSHTQASVLIPALVILAALLLRVGMLSIDARFHPDEALFAAQARLISAQGDWLLRTTDLDKPPLTFYLTALSFKVLSPSELAARLPNVFFSVLSVAALYLLAKSLYGNPLTALIAALLLTLSPYDLAFAATVFTDVQATFWVLVACLFAARDRWTMAGMAVALTFAAKSTTIMFLPLILALGIVANVQVGWRLHDVLRRLWEFAWPLLAGIALLLLWDHARAPRSFFDLGYTRNDPGRLIRANELWPRLEQWGRWLGAITGSDVLNVTALIALPLWLLHSMRHRTRAGATDWLIAGFSIAFLGWYWLVAFNTYDRYIHTLAPFVLLLLARVLTGLWRLSGAHQWTRVVTLLLLIGLMAPGILTTLRENGPAGGDHGTHTGIDALAGFMNSHLGGETVYDHWLGWELAYYLGPEPDVQLRYMAQPEACADEMRRSATARYFVAPSIEYTAPWLAALARVHIRVIPIYHDRAHDFVIYKLTPYSE